MTFKTNAIRRGLAACGVGSLALGMAGPGIAPAYAQTSFTMEEVLVVARRREEPQQRTPVSVTAMDSNDLRAAQIQNIGDLTREVPGLARREGNKVAGLTIRGVGQSRSSVRVDPGVGVYVDNVYLPRNDTQLAEIINAEAVEVVRGPQGTLFGRNTIGGAVLLTTAKPGEVFSGYAQADIGDLGRQNYRLNVNGPITDTLFAGVTLDSANEDGYREDAVSGEEFGDTDKQSVLAQVRWEATDDFMADFMLFYSEQDENAAPAVCRLANTDAAIQRLTAPGDSSDYGDLCRESERLNDKDEEVLMDRERVARWTKDDLLAGLTLNWDLDLFTLKSYTGYLKQDNISRSADPDGNNLFSTQNMVEVSRQFNANGLPGDDEERSFFSQEFQITGSAFDDFMDYTAGVFYSDEQIDDEADGTIVGPGGWVGFPSADGSMVSTIAGQGVRDLYISSLESRSTAVFGQVNLNLNEMWQVTLGGRYTYEEREIDQDNYVSTDPGQGTLSREDFDALVDYIHTIGVNPETPSVDDDDDWTTFTPAASVAMFLPTDDSDFLNDGMLYVSASKGFKAGGFSALDADIETYDPEEVWSYEFGYKLDMWENRMRLNGAIYYTDYTDMQLAVTRTDTSVIPAENFVSFTNAGESSITGAEIEFSVLPFDGAYIGFTASYIDAEYDEFEDEDLDGNVIDRSDEDFPYVPETTYSFVAQYEWYTEWGFIVPRLSGYYTDEVFFGLDASAADVDEAYIDDYTLWNFRLAWQSGDDNNNWEVAAYVDNFTDEEYFGSGVISVDGIGAASVIPGKQRTYGVQLYYSW